MAITFKYFEIRIEMAQIHARNTNYRSFRISRARKAIKINLKPNNRVKKYKNIKACKVVEKRNEK